MISKFSLSPSVNDEQMHANLLSIETANLIEGKERRKPQTSIHTGENHREDDFNMASPAEIEELYERIRELECFF